VTPPIAPSAENPLNITQTGDRTPACGSASNLPLSLSRPDPNNVINTMVKMAVCPKKNDVIAASDVTVVNNDVVAANSDVVLADSFYMSISEGRLSSSSSDVSSSSRSSERLSRRASMKKNEKILQVRKQECHCPYEGTGTVPVHSVQCTVLRMRIRISAWIFIKLKGRIRIRIKVKSWIRIRINLKMTRRNVWNVSLFEHFFKGSSDPQPHQSEKQDPDPHQGDADS
jgi:hypothetical protein